MFNNSPIQAKVIFIISEVTKDPDISVSSSSENTPAWDSLAYLVIAEEVERFYNLQISAENISNFNSVKQIVALVEQERNK